MSISIEEKLVSIEKLLLGQKNVLTFDEGCEFTGLSKTYMYKLTHQNRIPFFKPHGKNIYFSREKLKEALLIDFITGGRGYRVKTRYKILTPNLQSNLIPNPEPLYNKTKTKNKINQSDNFYNEKNGRKYSQREFITSGSDFDE